MMRPSNIRSFNHKDNLARQHRRHFLVKLILLIWAALAVLAGIVYFLFFSKVFEVRGISLNGLSGLDNKFVYDDIRALTEKRTLGYLKIQKNILFFDDETLEAQLLSEAPVIKEIQIKKKLFHNIDISFTERKPAGIWCFRDKCRYFDDDKFVWGDAAQSKGFLILSIQDKRAVNDDFIPDNFFKGISEVYSGLSGMGSKIKIKNIVIPADSFGEFRVYTDRNYYVIFSLDSDLPGQIEVLDIFLTKKDSDPSFNPQYLDLRIDGRVYYK